MKDQNSCQFCGEEVSTGDKFCNNCGAEIEEAQIEKTITAQVVAQQPVAQKTKDLDSEKQPQEVSKLRLMLSIIGIIFGALSLFYLVIFFAWGVYYAWLIAIPITTILGIIFSLLSKNKVLGIIGMILNGIGFVIELIFWIIVLVLYLVLNSFLGN
jgi:hypothetical protein